MHKNELIADTIEEVIGRLFTAFSQHSPAQRSLPTSQQNNLSYSTFSIFEKEIIKAEEENEK